MNKTNLITLILTTLLFTACNQKNKTTSAVAAQSTPAGVQWHDISTAKAQAKATGKDIFIFVHATWCPKCDNLKSTTLQDPQVIDILNAHFVPVMFNAQETKTMTWEGSQYNNPNYDDSKDIDSPNAYHELVYELGAEAIPSMLVKDQSLNTLASILGFKDSNRLLWLLSDATGRFNYKLKK